MFIFHLTNDIDNAVMQKIEKATEWKESKISQNAENKFINKRNIINLQSEARSFSYIALDENYFALS